MRNYYGRGAAVHYDALSYYDYHKLTRSILSSMKRKGKILDIGTGTGSMAMELAKCGFKVDGIDKSKHMLAVAIQKSRGRANPKFYLQSAANIKLKGPYDAIISQGGVLAFVGMYMESYMPSVISVKKLLRKMHKLLKREGLAIISVQSDRPKQMSMPLKNGIHYYGIARRKGKFMIVTHIIRRDGKIAARQTFKKLLLTKRDFDKMAGEAGFQVLGKNNSCLHYILKKPESRTG